MRLSDLIELKRDSADVSKGITLPNRVAPPNGFLYSGCEIQLIKRSRVSLKAHGGRPWRLH